MRPYLKELTIFLDSVFNRLQEGDVEAAMKAVILELSNYCARLKPEEWAGELIPACRSHRVHPLLLQDPYTYRAFEKPRGYAGDAVMLDYVYTGIAPEGTTALGRELFKATTGSTNAQSVNARRGCLVRYIDAVAQAMEQPAILSIACGHLREAQAARCVRQGWGGVFYALDQDAQSLTVVAQEQSSRGVKIVHSSLGNLLRGERTFPPLSLIYAAGLFDYLSDPVAERLASLMFKMLAPGQRVLIANFAPDSQGRGYMEAIMDWQLIYRDEEQVETLARHIPRSEIASKTIYRDPFENIVFLELTKSG